MIASRCPPGRLTTLESFWWIWRGGGVASEADRPSAVPTDAAQHLLVDGAVLPVHLLVLDLLSPLLAHGRSRLTGCLPTGLKRRHRHALALQALQVGIAGNAD